MDVGNNVSKPTRLLSNVKFLLVAGGGLLADGYLNTTIGLVVPVLGYIYWKDNKGSVPAIQGDEIKASFIIGMMIGQLAFGSLGDALGRHRVYGKECIFTICGTLLVVLLPWRGLSQTGIVAWLSVFRFITGMGTGGDYPMTSALSAEHSIIGSRARLIMGVFSFNALGAFTAGIVLLVLLAAFKSSIEVDINHLEWVWRLLLGLGIVPAILTLYARMKMNETDAYKKYVANDTDISRKKRNYKTQIRDFQDYFSTWKHARVLFATSASWFLYDIASYGISLNQSIVLGYIGFTGGNTPWETLWKIAIGNTIVQCAVSQIIMAASQTTANSNGRAGYLFPTRVRGSAHGISAASGKAGALLTAYGFASLAKKIGLRGVLGLMSGLLFLVVLLTLWIPEAKGKSLEEIENDVLFGEEVRGRDLDVDTQTIAPSEIVKGPTTCISSQHSPDRSSHLEPRRV